MASVQWMWADAGTSSSLSRWNPVHWSLQSTPFPKVLSELKSKGSVERAVRIYVKSKDSGEEREVVCQGPAEAVEVLCGSYLLDSIEPVPVDVFAAVDEFRLRKAAVRRGASEFGSWPPSAPPERCRHCIECGSLATEHCEACGLALCTQPRVLGPRCLTLQPMSTASKAPGQVKTCRRCAVYAQARAASRFLLRHACAAAFRSVLAAQHLVLGSLAPPLEMDADCAGCGIVFDTWNMVPGARPHHCHVCGRRLCAVCLCGNFTCMGTPLRCPHKVQLLTYEHRKPEKCCKDCLPLALVRQTASQALQAAIATATDYANHGKRVIQYLEDPANFPLYQQDFKDSATHKALRVGGAVVEGAKFVAPFVSAPWAFGITTAHTVWNYGQYGLLGLFLSTEIVDGLQTMRTMSESLRALDARQLLVGAMYLSAEHRSQERSAPAAAREEALALGRPISECLLELLLGLAGVGMRAPYEERAFDAQRLASQQRWRLVTERLSVSSKHRPAWCLYMHQEHRVAMIAIRGTDAERSLGGDLFTDVNALPERMAGVDGSTIVAHSGMLASARALEPELRQALRALVSNNYKIMLVGHSLGAGTAALLCWLLKNGAPGERLPAGAQIFGVGYASPSVVDRATAEAMKPYFTSVVNSMDVVPRLNLRSLHQLAEEISTCAREAGGDLPHDVEAVLDRLTTVWAPRVRGTSQEREESGVATTQMGHASSFLKKMSKKAAAAMEVQPQSSNGGTNSNNSKRRFNLRSLSSSLSMESLPEDTPEPCSGAGAESDAYVQEALRGANLQPGESCTNGSAAWRRSLLLGLAKTAAAEKKPKAAGSAAARAGSSADDEDALSPHSAEEAEGAGLAVPAELGEEGADGVQILSRECPEEASLWIPGGAESVVVAWYGDLRKEWQACEGAGREVTEEVKAAIDAKGMLAVGNRIFGDPCPKTKKKLMVLVEEKLGEELFCPGIVVWLYRANGSLEAAEVPCDLPPLRRVICDKRLVKDHTGLSYHRALLTVRARKSSSRVVEWQSFAEASEHCPCCHEDYNWDRTTRSKKQRWLSMTNCRACGQVVCLACTSTRQAIQDLGILDPARVCDSCAWRGPDGGAALGVLDQIFEGSVSSAARQQAEEIVVREQQAHPMS